ncbi:uncharacterized protein LOC129579287 [Sitodiplosis mosellana]|uniref:uncharacterized protein LOC129579287 n=1 Tax=Sitodiplosis mosellana TaxID=263140 RepID=UPI002443BE01|nr:uncharacterized protein LOC129579287 [Sitodiplosis mosellana]XP_055325192.1 uncharacterized protein LOC129579287 [Sitodiplosis mosellana]XP_055325193.1 uncharacterized protein LOC129579287 [Sitodiplosis mosellana]XP_055325195.1 uncharacterized protein LOC129579287 [Sitodiplosis mosellana]XP_055325196.1 uncharacterized protein LOC129579287 [Sitodiplosis mosellana]XP_055325197.1 uncharacterized protein LOC129579287 [Sitodiplosis mosellana]XP_055325198.1 uncharacterized protein LOC129579287 [
MATRAIVILIAIWCVIQGFAYGIMSILALLAHDCQLPMRQSKIPYLMYIIFFRDQRCDLNQRIDWNIVADIPPPTEPIWPSVTQVAFRTNIIAFVYLTLSTIWIITSLMLIVGCFMACLQRVAYYLLVMPWAIFTTLTSILDVVAVGFFFYDLFNTLNTESFVHHMEMQNTSTEFASLLISANILPIPAVIMLIVAGRGFIFWCFNILSIPIVLAYMKNILYGSKRTAEASDERDFQYARSHAHGNNNILESHFPSTERSRYSDPSYYHQYQYDNMSYQQDKYDLSRTIGRRYIEPLKGETIDEPDNHAKRMAISRNSSNEDKSSKKSSWSDDSGHSTSTVHLAQTASMAASSNGGGSKMDTDARSSSYNWREMPTDAVLKIERPHFRLPHKPSLLKKLSDSSYVPPSEEPHHQTAHQYTGGEELRSQLPWSYFGGARRSDAIKPKKSFVELRDDEDLPPVPVPDYTMKFPPRDQQGRPLNGNERRRVVPAKKFINPKRGAVTSREHERSQWSGPEVRY